MGPKVIEIVKLVAVMIAAVVVGNWFLAELKKARKQGKPLYQAYMTIPGIVIISAIILLPIVLWAIKK